MLLTVPSTHHGIHGKVVVLCLQVQGVLVAHTDLCVALQEQLLVVADPVEHLEGFTQRQVKKTELDKEGNSNRQGKR